MLYFFVYITFCAKMQRGYPLKIGVLGVWHGTCNVKSHRLVELHQVTGLSPKAHNFRLVRKEGYL